MSDLLTDIMDMERGIQMLRATPEANACERILQHYDEAEMARAFDSRTLSEAAELLRSKYGRPVLADQIEAIAGTL